MVLEPTKLQLHCVEENIKQISEKPTHIFIVVRTTDDGGDIYRSSIKASLDKDKVEAFVAEQIENDTIRGERLHALSKFDEEWATEHPCPPFPELKKITRWQPGLRDSEITPEMRAERNALEEENEALKAAYHTLSEKWDTERMAALKEFATTKLKFPEDEVESLVDDLLYGHFRYSRRYYKIEEVELI